VADRENHRIQKFDSSGTWERAWGKGVNGGTAGTGFEVCTVAANCLVGSSGGLGGELLFPSGVATDASGNVYVSEDDRVQKFSSLGTWERAWGKGVDSATAGTAFEVCIAAENCLAAAVSSGKGGEMNTPYGIATGPGGKVYVAETFSGSGRVQKFNSVGTWERAWGRDVNGGFAYGVCTDAEDCQNGLAGGLGGEMTFPRGVGTDAAGNVYVAEGNRVQRFDAFGVWDRAWGENVNGGGVFGICTAAESCLTGASGDDPGGEMNGPMGIATDPAGAVYVGDTFSHRIQRFDTAGVWHRAWGKRVNGAATVFGICTVAPDCRAGLGGVLGGEVNTPIGVAFASAGSLYVADSINNRIQKFGADPVGAPPGVNPTPSPQSGPTGKRAAALKKCKKKKRRARAACKKKAKKLPV
jgi:hypothetical protein